MVAAAGPLAHATSVLLCTALWRKNHAVLQMMNASCLHGIKYALQHKAIQGQETSDYGLLHIEGKSKFSYLVALAEIVIGSWSLYLSIAPQVSNETLTARSVQLIERLDKVPGPVNRVLARVVTLAIGLLLTGKMISARLSTVWYQASSAIHSNSQKKSDLGKQMNASRQEAQRCAQAVKVITGKLLWKPSAARAELSQFDLCRPSWPRIAAKTIGLHLILPQLVMIGAGLADIIARGHFSALLNGQPIEINFADRFALWNTELSFLDSIHPERLLGGWRWIIHQSDPEIFKKMAIDFISIFSLVMLSNMVGKRIGEALTKTKQQAEEKEE